MKCNCGGNECLRVKGQETNLEKCRVQCQETDNCVGMEWDGYNQCYLMFEIPDTMYRDGINSFCEIYVCEKCLDSIPISNILI